MPTIDNAYLFYTKIQDPGLKYQSKNEYAWSVDVCVPKAVAKEWNKKFGKQKAKEFDNEEFKTVFKSDPPFPEQDEQYILKIRKDCQYTKDGEVHQVPEQYRPRVYDASGEDITESTLIGNGSKGAVSYQVNETVNYGSFAKLSGVRVDELIPYEKPSRGGDARSELFGGSASSTVQQTAPTAAAAKRGAHAKPAKSPDPDDVLDDDLPF